MDTPSHLTAEQRALAHYMSGLSEEAYCAGWMSGLEYALWEVVLGRRREYGGLPIEETQRNELRELSRRCGGWIVFDDAKGETWLPLDAWKARFAEWESGETDGGS